LLPRKSDGDAISMTNLYSLRSCLNFQNFGQFFFATICCWFDTPKQR